MLACTALVGCTNEEVIDNPNENPVLNGSDKAYLAIKLVDSNSATSRAEGNGDKPFHYGTAAENEVKSVDLYFYYDGVYETYVNDKSYTWTDETADTDGTKTIESYSNAVIVLKGLSEQNKNSELPNGVLCVINAPDEFVNGTTTYADLQGLDYDKALAVLHNHYATVQNETAYFIMSNSAFNGAGDLYTPQANFGNYLAPIAEANFMKEEPTPQDVIDNAVEICVERLAAKVKVGLSDETTITATDQTSMALGDPITVRKIEIDENGKATTTFEETQLYLKIEGWGLNGTNKNNYAIKNIDPAWNLGFTWNDATNNRSYWAKSPNYGGGNYPANFAAAAGTATDKSSVEGTDKTDASTYTLNYYSWNELGKTIGSSDYCMENTNTAEILKANFASSLTSVLVKAKAYVKTKAADNTETESAFSFVRYNNTFYTPESFLAQVWNQVNLQYYYQKDDQTYALWSPEHLTEVNIYDGKVDVALKTDAPTTWYTKVANAAGGYDYTEVENPQIATRLNNLSIEAEYFNDGMMYYNIPIEHLRGGTYAFANDGSVTLNEADYGIVRNHYYNISLKSIANLGTSVYDPDEDIIVQIVKNDTYAISAKINILSWKIVNQEVEL